MMARDVTFSPRCLAQYFEWQSMDKRTAQKINKLIIEISRDPFEGIGKPEPLKGDFSGFWSRRIDEKHRLIYRVAEDDNVHLESCYGHYLD